MSGIVTPKMFGQQLFGQYADGLVFYWRGIPAGNVVDESLYRNHGTITGATWVGDGLRFDAVVDGDNVDIPDSSILRFGTGDFTIIAIVDMDASQANGLPQIMGKGDTGATEWMFGEGSVGGHKIRFYGGNGSIEVVGPEESFPFGQKHQYIARRLGSTVTVWKDAVIVGTDNTASDDLSTTKNLQLGGADSAANRWLGGVISDVKIYNRALSATEIAALFLNPNLPMQQEPIWLFKAPVVGVTMAAHYYRHLMQGVA